MSEETFFLQILEYILNLKGFTRADWKVRSDTGTLLVLSFPPSALGVAINFHFL